MQRRIRGPLRRCIPSTPRSHALRGVRLARGGDGVKIHCTACRQPVSYHCPKTNATCTWLACLNPACNVRYFDVDRGLIQYTDGSVETWEQQPSSSQPPAITIEDTTDGGTTTPDP